tara:strand:+ start:4929 stop:5069 length:141 start_codon:yes stop_codon:yes gene_type:complete
MSTGIEDQAETISFWEAWKPAFVPLIILGLLIVVGLVIRLINAGAL